MPFPLNSQLATPLGDILPMRFSWLFIGYSTPYEVFSGIMETIAGLLLLYRRTTTLGVLVALAVFTNVMMLNLCYDIPVKLYSMNLVAMCVYLVANEYKRISCFFILNKPAQGCTAYHFPLTKKWMKVARLILKLCFAGIIVYNIYTSFGQYRSVNKSVIMKPFNNNFYDVTKFVVNHDTLPPLLTDTMRWQDMIIEKDGFASIKTSDTIFRKRYGRMYFNYEADTIKQTVKFKKYAQDSLPLFTLRYQLPDDNTIVFFGKNKNDSLYIELKKSNHHFPLAEKQFHWLSEANR